MPKDDPNDSRRHRAGKIPRKFSPLLCREMVKVSTPYSNHWHQVNFFGSEKECPSLGTQLLSTQPKAYRLSFVSAASCVVPALN